MKLAVFIPAKPEDSDIVKGSGIVGEPLFTDDPAVWMVTYFEGNLFDAANLRRYVERVSAAAGRFETGYPTVAKATVPSESLVYIGMFDTLDQTVHLESPHIERLNWWLNRPANSVSYLEELTL